MRPLTRIAVLILCFMGANAFAAGGACPSGLPVTGNNCYFVAASGSDSNSGTSETSPWAHAPGMPSCTANCAAVTPSAGEGFIFKGGDTWHFSNSKATPYTGGTWKWTWSGTTGNHIYIGVDPSWYSGASWARPILNADNPLTPNPGVPGDSVASCTYQIGTDNQIWVGTLIHDFTLDGFEMTGLCNLHTSQINLTDDYIDNRASYNATFDNIYIHGWTHTPGAAQNIRAVEGGDGGIGPYQQNGNLWTHMVIDGSDSDPQGALCGVFEGWYDTEYSVFRYISQMVAMDLHVFHDNLMEYWYATTPSAGHGNMLEVLREANQNNAYYNNVFRHIFDNAASEGAGNVIFWPFPTVGYTDYFFNNVFYDVYGSNYFDLGHNSNYGNQGGMYSFNNTFESLSNDTIMECGTQGYAYPFIFANNHYITDGSAYNSYCSSSGQSLGIYTELQQSHAKASGQGYSSKEGFAYSPSSASGSTVGTGTNESGANNQHFCNNLLAESDPALQAAGRACESDTTYACTYDTSNHTVICPARTPASRPSSGAWDIGAYQYGQTSTVNPPTNLTATVQ